MSLAVEVVAQGEALRKGAGVEDGPVLQGWAAIAAQWWDREHRSLRDVLDGLRIPAAAKHVLKEDEDRRQEARCVAAGEHEVASHRGEDVFLSSRLLRRRMAAAPERVLADAEQDAHTVALSLIFLARK